MYENLIDSEQVSHASDFFDGSEFEARASLEGRHFWHVHRREVLYRELQRYLAGQHGDTCHMIEFGCGIGTVATYLNDSGFHVDYSDIYGEALEIAQRRAAERGNWSDNRRYLRADITHPIPASLNYDGVLLLDVIEHLPDDEGALRNVRAALSSDANAFVLVTVPAYEFLWSPWDDMEKHKRRYTFDSLRRVLATSGYEVERMTHVFGALFFAALGVKGMRWMRKQIFGASAPENIANMAEIRDLGVVNDAVRTVLSLEQPVLQYGQLPLGTSILAIARRR